MLLKAHYSMEEERGSRLGFIIVLLLVVSLILFTLFYLQTGQANGDYTAVLQP